MLLADSGYEHDGPFLLIVDNESVGALYFGPFRASATAERMAKRLERLAPSVQWSIEALQPGSYAPEWARIIAEQETE